MDDKEILNNIIPELVNKKNFIYEGVRSITFAVIKKDNINPNVIHYESTNKKWSKFYTNVQESKLCHIMRKGAECAKTFDEFTLVWNLLHPNNKESIFLNNKRIDLDHCNGLSICKNISDELLLCTLFTGAQQDVNFVEIFLKNKRDFLQNLFTNANK